MSVADRVYCFREGRVVLQGSSRVLDREAISQAYCGIR
jgi:ABC-type branched-subunit amino acid transport system ATPase component